MFRTKHRQVERSEDQIRSPDIGLAPDSLAPDSLAPDSLASAA
jgi:hypothetical protein